MEEKMPEPTDIQLDEKLPPQIVVVDDEEKLILRKIDVHLMPFMFVTYMLQYLDKITLGYTAVMGIQADIHLVGQQYSWCSSAFYFGYLVASFPGSIGFVKFPLGKYLSTAILCWSIILMCHGAASNFTSLIILRVLLGVFESIISPGFSLITGLWYKPSEHSLRHGIWFAGNGQASIFGGVLGYAIGEIRSPLAAWRWLFIIFGLITFVWSMVLMIFMPDSALNARWLTPHEREIAHSRPQKQSRSFKSTHWKPSQALEAIMDPKTWLLFFYTALTSLPNGGVTNFTSVIIKGLGYGELRTLQLGMPQGACQVVFTLTAAYLATKLRRSRCIIIACLLCIATLGWCLVGYLPASHKSGRLGGVCIFAAYASGFPLSLSIIASDVAGYTKKTVVSAILFLAYCAGNISGPQVFFAREAPHYQTGCKVCIICLCLGIVDILVLRQYMDWENKRRDKAQGVKIEAEPGRLSGEIGVVELPSAGLDETDWEQEGFRYIL
ncbi:putative vitamin H transporter [Mollisia scopiformis]|uniref:Putative vitamin H transporter n=1 Tax=Mollisia scopiformis TaxID=149040 RepID=A0A132BD62_MOLSC|nr:putative vitamin H transporter [Mollisia scopiformis]KUJ09597.1 putative vitamin H transporter [Mollisia scopiformis]